MIGATGRRSSVTNPALWSRLAGLPGIDTAVAAFALVLSAGVFRDEFLYQWTYGTAIRQILWLAIYLFVIVWMWRRFGYDWLLWSARHLPLMCLVMVVAFASTLWSLEPAITFRRSLLLIATTMVGVFLGYNFAPRALMRILFWVLAGLLVVSAFTSVAFPEYGTVKTYRVSQTFDAWQGVFSNKNSLGTVAAVACVLFSIGTLYGRIERYVGLVLVALSLIALLMSRGATSYVVALTGLFVASSFAIARRLRFPALVTFFYLVFGLVCAAWIATAAMDDFAGLLNRDGTLTKRTLVWSDALEIISARPWTGYGYEAVWGKGGQTWFPDLQTANWAAHGHNAFLDLATQVGLPVALLALAHFLIVLAASVQAYLKHRSPSTLFAASYVFMTLIANIPASSFFSQGSGSWILFVAVSTMAMRVVDAPAPSRTSHASKRRRSDRRRLRRSSGAREPGHVADNAQIR